MHIKETLLLSFLAMIFYHLYGYSQQIAQNKVEFEKWIKIHNKRYSNQIQKYYRYMIFSQNAKMIKQHNIKAQKGLSKYTMKINSHADKKYEQYTFGLQKSKKHNSNFNITLNCSGIILDTPNPPQSINWIEKKTVNEKLPIQFTNCTSSWAFSAVAAVQGLYKIKKGSLQQMSTAQIIQCSGPYGNEECYGGFMEQAYWYIIDNGIALNSTYRTSNISDQCRYLKSQKYTGIGRCAAVPSENYSKLQSAVVQQPVTAAIAFPKQLIFYSDGIFDEQECNPQIHLDRGVLIVGYGEQQDGKYWDIIYSRKSDDQSGRLKLLRKQQNGPGTCGIQLAASVPQNIG